jgi:lipoyl(octanoyl) transferase
MDLRLLPFGIVDGYHNMAADEALLQSATAGVASLRFYGWSVPTVSLGYFESSESRSVRTLPWVRRQTGGKTLVHHHELTYALALPPGCGDNWLTRMHKRVILPALERLGLRGDIVGVETTKPPTGDDLCFLYHTAGDLLCHGAKIVGSAQRRRRRCLLQHGSILLARSEHAPQLPGILELTGVACDSADLQENVVEEIRRETGWRVVPGSWTPREEGAIEELVRDRYSTVVWNEKR